ncbi:TPA: hypothetical protein DEB00_02615 [Candidatus Uhrbacteria bacterium]|nr:hypothetical protein [Candidatus Uhrbacteria bacterium]
MMTLYLIGLESVPVSHVQKEDRGIRVIPMAPRDGTPRGILVTQRGERFYRTIFHGTCPVHVLPQMPPGITLI